MLVTLRWKSLDEWLSQRVYPWRLLLPFFLLRGVVTRSGAARTTWASRRGVSLTPSTYICLSWIPLSVSLSLLRAATRLFSNATFFLLREKWLEKMEIDRDLGRCSRIFNSTDVLFDDVWIDYWKLLSNLRFLISDYLIILDSFERTGERRELVAIGYFGVWQCLRMFETYITQKVVLRVVWEWSKGKFLSFFFLN